MAPEGLFGFLGFCLRRSIVSLVVTLTFFIFVPIWVLIYASLLLFVSHTSKTPSSYQHVIRAWRPKHVVQKKREQIIKIKVLRVCLRKRSGKINKEGYLKNKKKIENTLFLCGNTLLKLELLCSLNSQSVERPLKMSQFNGAKPHSDNLTIPGSLFGHIIGPIYFLAWCHPFINGDGIATEKSSKSTAIFFFTKVIYSVVFRENKSGLIM